MKAESVCRMYINDLNYTGNILYEDCLLYSRQHSWCVVTNGASRSAALSPAQFCINP